MSNLNNNNFTTDEVKALPSDNIELDPSPQSHLKHENKDKEGLSDDQAISQEEKSPESPPIIIVPSPIKLHHLLQRLSPTPVPKPLPPITTEINIRARPMSQSESTQSSNATNTCPRRPVKKISLAEYTAQTKRREEKRMNMDVVDYETEKLATESVEVEKKEDEKDEDEKEKEVEG